MALFDDHFPKLPLKGIPGDLGIPVIGPISDRYHYNNLQGHFEFIKSHMEEYNSTVFRMNLILEEFIMFQTLNMRHQLLSPVGKKLVPIWILRMKNMGNLKVSTSVNLRLYTIKPFKYFIHLLLLFSIIESDVAVKGEANFNTYSDDMAFNLLLRVFFDINPTKCFICNNKNTKTEDVNIYDVIYISSTPVFDKAKNLGLSKEETCYNLGFMSGANAYAGLRPLFRAVMKWLYLGGEKLHKDLVNEIRAVVKSEGGVVTLALIEKMKLTKSVVFEILRMEPSVPHHSHDASYQVKKGEFLFGYQPLAMRDPLIFENPNEFIATRFLGEGEKLLKYVYWCNERQTTDTIPNNKQCTRKDIALLFARLMVVELFLRYDTFTAEIGKNYTGSTVTVKTLSKATSIN
ncbi:hypothetical protein MKX01_013080 [Papaver californicum]|nr:hypothetical protein MKX01_013080 [Papaver californicum]